MSHAAPPWYVATISDALEAQIAQALDFIHQHERFLVVSHVRPDGDAVGSTLAMSTLLELMGKQVIRFNVDPVPYNFDFLPGAQGWTNDAPALTDVDALVMLDCGERHRLGDDFPSALWALPVLMVDHHKTWNPSIAQVAIHDASASATGELVYHLASRAGVPLTLALAQCIYCCVLTDTGSFRYASTTSAVLKIAGTLIDAGVEPWFMTSHIYESQPMSRIMLLGEVLKTLSFSPCRRIAFLSLDDEMLQRAGASAEQADGFINYGRGIMGVEVATQLMEMGDKGWKISFRSRGLVDVSALASRFGGGGHHNAAACMMQGSADEIRQLLSQALVELLD